eukprot:2933273-Rhodomonas_salina.1
MSGNHTNSIWWSQGHRNIKLEKNQEIIVEAVGERYTEFEGYKSETETRVGLSYAKLCSSVKAGNRILVADGSVVIERGHSTCCYLPVHAVRCPELMLVPSGACYAMSRTEICPHPPVPATRCPDSALRWGVMRKGTGDPVGNGAERKGAQRQGAGRAQELQPPRSQSRYPSAH